MTVGCAGSLGSLLAASSSSVSSFEQRGQRSPFWVTGGVSCHCRTNNPGSCPKKGRDFQEPFLTKLFRKPFRERDANLSLHNPFQCLLCLEWVWGFPLKSMAAVHPSLPMGRSRFSPVCPHWIQPGHIQSLFFHPKYLFVPMRPFFHDFFPPDLQV